MDLPLHPVLVHFPIALAVILPLLLLLVILGQKKGLLSMQTWWLLAVLQVISAGTGYLAMEAGEDDEEKVEKFVPEAAIEEHEEKAEVFVYTSAGLMALILLAGFFPQRQSLKILSLVISLAVAAMAVGTGHTGGKIIYQFGGAQGHVPK